MHRRLYYIICSLLIITPLIAGLELYLVFRPDTYISRFLSSTGNLSIAGNMLITDSPWFCYLSKNYLPDLCWAFSLEACLAVIFHNSERMIINSLIISAVFLSLMETLQVTPLIPGTFDVFDIGIELAAIVFSGIIINLLRKRCFYEKND